MHGYCTKETEESKRRTAIKIMIAIAVPLTPLVNLAIKQLSLCMQDTFIVGKALTWLVANGISLVVSYASVFSIILLLVDHVFWKNILSKLLGVPNLNGNWVGLLHSNSNGGVDLDMTLHITQTWTRIQCTATFPKSSSESTMARVFWKNAYEVRLEFAFCNESQEPNVLQKEYHGFNWFTVRKDTMTGFYFTDRIGQDGSTKTDGNMELTKAPRKIHRLLHKNVTEKKQAACETEETMGRCSEIES